MRLSEAIRRGVKETVPAQGQILFLVGGEVYACALGAAHIGSGGSKDMYQAEVYEAIENLWPELNTVFIPDEPEMETKQSSRPLEEAIWVRNDRLSWSRERIADWLEGLGY